MATWRLQLKSGAENDIDISKYCLKNGVAAMGWSLLDLPDSDRKSIQSFSDYCALAGKKYKNFDSVRRLVEGIKENDIIWIRSSGKYYIGRVKASSRWRFVDTDEAKNLDACNQLTDIQWYPATMFADEESVPGAINTAFFRGQTLQRIKKCGIDEYSQMLFNQVHDRNEDAFEYAGCKPLLSEKHFYNLLQPEDVEDLLCIWLFDKKGYICIPSTNKISTPKYECVLIDPNDKSGKHIYIQVKKGEVDLDADDYADLKGEVYLLTTEGKIKNLDNGNQNIFGVNPTDIYEYAINPEKSHMVPEGISLWVKFLSDVENSNRDVSEVMF